MSSTKRTTSRAGGRLAVSPVKSMPRLGKDHMGGKAIADNGSNGVSSGGIDDNTSFRYALIAGILFIVSFLAWFFGIIIFEGDEWSWQSAYATLGAMTSVFLLCSILFTMLGKRELSRKSLVVGVLLLIGLIVLFAIRTITYQHGYA